jgi:ABC-type phosphate transport system permease subunit
MGYQILQEKKNGLYSKHSAAFMLDIVIIPIIISMIYKIVLILHASKKVGNVPPCEYKIKIINHNPIK